MIASTNLVFEIFLVIVTLLGWSFFGGEIIGGVLFIIIGAALINWLLTKDSIQQAKDHIKKSEGDVHQHDPHAHHAGMNMTTESDNEHAHHQQLHKIDKKFYSRIKDTSRYFYMVVLMVGKDILVGVRNTISEERYAVSAVYYYCMECSHWNFSCCFCLVR